MPELPEVETIRRQLEPKLTGTTIIDCWTFGTPKFSDATKAQGSTVSDVRRRGKYLVIGLYQSTAPTESELVIHLGMTGRLAVLTRDGIGDFAHLRAKWTLDNDRILAFDDVRRFGRVAVVRPGDYESLPTLSTLGPEPFDEAFSPEHLRAEINRSRRAIKTQLLSQRVVAGVGNIYADEALWLAEVNPRARTLTKVKAAALRDEIRNVLRAGIDDGGTTLRNYRDADGGTGSHQEQLWCYGRSGEECRRCGSTLRRTVIDARSTTFCPTCQRR